MLKIGDFSRLSRISIRMLRHYDEMELLKPEKVDNFTGYRYYSAEQLTSAGRISMLKNMGFSLAEIIEINKNYSSAESLQQFLSVKYAEVKEKAEIMNERLDLIKTTIDRLRKDKIMSKYDVNIKEMPQRYVASLRKVIPSYDKEGMLWEQMSKETKRLNMQVDNMCDSLAVFHDEGFKESDVDVEIQISVQGKYENTENVVFKQWNQYLLRLLSIKEVIIY